MLRLYNPDDEPQLPQVRKEFLPDAEFERHLHRIVSLEAPVAERVEQLKNLFELYRVGKLVEEQLLKQPRAEDHVDEGGF